MEEQRKAFEEWFSQSFPRESIERFKAIGSGGSPYKSQACHCAWLAWLAAIEHAKRTMCNKN